MYNPRFTFKFNFLVEYINYKYYSLEYFIKLLYLNITLWVHLKKYNVCDISCVKKKLQYGLYLNKRWFAIIVTILEYLISSSMFET